MFKEKSLIILIKGIIWRQGMYSPLPLFYWLPIGEDSDCKGEKIMI